jgi:protein SCO1/2
MFLPKLLKVSFVLLATALLAACNQQSSSPKTVSPKAQSEQKTFLVKGVVKELKPDGKTAVIKHEEIPDYMAAMTMPFEVKDPKELNGLKPGDAISFRMIVTEDEGWIDRISKLNKEPEQAPSRETLRVVRDVEPLKVGDLLPDYHFTNELGQAVSLSQFKGQALALTFIFTSCPFPNFCPRMASNFAEAAKKLSATQNAPKNWHLLALSFDPANDTPARLKTYAEVQHYDPKQWSFLTGDLIDITAITEQFGQQFWHDGTTISHNLRTVVIDARGRIQKIFPENKWTSDELAQELTQAAAAKGD